MFNTNVHLSEVMAAAQAQVNYSVDNNGSQLLGERTCICSIHD